MIHRRMFFLIAALTMPSCSPDPNAHFLPEKGQLRRTETNSWETRRSPSLRIEFEAPTHLCKIAEEKTLGLVIAMHAVPPPKGILDDQQCLLEIHLVRKKSSEDQATATAEAQALDKYDGLSRWERQRHDAISRFDIERFSYYRYDTLCPGGDLISGRASVVNVYDDGVSQYATEDEAIIRRIFNSIRCLE